VPSGNAASAVGFAHAIPLPRSRSSAALNLSGAFAMFVATASLAKCHLGCMALTLTDIPSLVTAKPRSADTIMWWHVKDREWCHSLLTGTSWLVTSEPPFPCSLISLDHRRSCWRAIRSTCLANSRNDRCMPICPIGRHRRNQYLALGPLPGCEAMACSTSRIKTQSSSAKMDEPHRCASLWKVACKQRIVLSRKTVTQDREGKLSRVVWGG
jgi:hypothetical protein